MQVRSETYDTNPSLQSRRAGHDRYLAFFELLRVIIDGELILFGSKRKIFCLCLLYLVFFILSYLVM